MKRFLSMSLALLLVALQLAACGGDSDKDNDTTNPSVESTDNNSDGLVADIPEDAYYEDYTFTVLTRGHEMGVDWNNDDIIVLDEDKAANEVNKAIYARNQAIYDRLGVTIDVRDSTMGRILDDVRTSIMSNYADDFDLAMLAIDKAAILAQEGLLVPFQDLPYVDLEKPWYDQRCIDELSYNDLNYFIFSDITVRNLDAIWIYLFNKDLIEANKLEDPYELVESGDWTMDKLQEMCATVTRDNGDQNWTLDDTWGIAGHDFIINATYAGAGERIVSVNESGSLELTMNNERVLEVIESINDIKDYWARYYLGNHGEPFGFAPGQNYAELTGAFTSGHVLFLGECMCVLEDIRDAYCEFGIVPSPKLNKDQDEYYAIVNKVAAISIVPNTVSDLERTSVIIEALAAESHDTLIPAYYEEACKDKYARDVMSGDMLDLIRNSVTYDLGVYYDWGGLNSEFTKLVYNTGEGFASTYASLESAALSKMNEFITFMDKAANS